MGYLDGSTITVDAILTKKGRELLAKGDGSFKITQFALGDDEILSLNGSSSSDVEEEIISPPVDPPKKIDNSHIPKPFVPIEPDAYENSSRETLLEQVHKRSGKKPHPRTGVPKLIAALRELDLSKVQE